MFVPHLRHMDILSGSFNLVSSSLWTRRAPVRQPMSVPHQVPESDSLHEDHSPITANKTAMPTIEHNQYGGLVSPIPTGDPKRNATTTRACPALENSATDHTALNGVGRSLRATISRNGSPEFHFLGICNPRTIRASSATSICFITY